MSGKKNTGYSEIFESEVPYDLIFIAILLALGIAAAILPFLSETPLRYALPLPLLFFIPGYCLVAAIFPKKDDIDLFERFWLSIAISITIVTLIGLGLNFSPWGIHLESIIIILSLFSILVILIAHIRRSVIPSEKRLNIQIFTLVMDLRKEIIPDGENGIDRILSILLVSVVTITIVTTAFVILVPQHGERFSEFYLISGENTLSDYPDRIIPGIDYPLNIGIGNQEQRNVTYTIETWILKTDFDPVTNTNYILSMESRENKSISLGHNETKVIPYRLRVNRFGYSRAEFLLFNETVPGPEVTGSDRINASYRDLHIQFITE